MTARALGLAACLIAGSSLATACGLVPEEQVGLECQRSLPDGREAREGQDPLAEGGPLEGLPVTEMTAETVGQRAEAAGFGVTYRYQYDVGPQTGNGSSGYSECWCVPPPGEVFAVAYDSIGRVIVMVQADEARDTVRPQPVRGWGCEDAPAAS
jgi:hypothetical protein